MSLSALGLSEIQSVWNLVYLVSMWSAEERGSEMIELIDMIKGIYIVDLEHVSDFWSSRESFETFVFDIRLENGVRSGYVNRTFYIFQNLLAMRESAGTLNLGGRLSDSFLATIVAAQNLARSGKSGERDVTSRDLLFCACTQDHRLSAALQQVGLQFEKLHKAILS